MKKKILAVLMAVTVISYAGCSISEVKASNEDSNPMFITVERNGIWDVVYHCDTKVMYVVSRGIENSGNFTLMVDVDGNPLLWQE